jgi:hypothetical protein
MIVRVFQILAVILVGVAVFFWYSEDNDWAFAAGVCAAAAYFLAMRFQMKERVRQADAENYGEDDDQEEDLLENK